MKKATIPLCLLALLAAGCDNDSTSKNVLSQRYIHKYGYDVSQEEWQAQSYPGQVLTTLRDGKTITESYEDGLLHGSRTETFPHSQTVQMLETYERGHLAKRITYNIRGVPQAEEKFNSPTHVVVTSWYPKGTPKSKEEFKDNILINGQYFSASNETDSRIENGTGERILRNSSGDILSREIFNHFALTYVETYFPNNTPHVTTSYENGKIHGEKKVFAMSGEPVSVQNYFHGKKHGISTYYQNGYKFLEVAYVDGLKDGMERQYIDGETLVEETQYAEGMKHGPSIVYCDGAARTSWYFEDNKVSRSKFESLLMRDDLITTMQH